MAKKFFLGMLIALIPGLAIADPALNGIWVDEIGAEFKFNNGNWEVWEAWYKPDVTSPLMKGTYTIMGGTINLYTTHVHGYAASEELWFLIGFDLDLEPRFYSRAELKSIMVAVIIAEEGPFSLEELAELDEEIDIYLDDIFSIVEGTYSVSGNTLNLTFYGETSTLTRM